MGSRGNKRIKETKKALVPNLTRSTINEAVETFKSIGMIFDHVTFFEGSRSSKLRKGVLFVIECGIGMKEYGYERERESIAC